MKTLKIKTFLLRVARRRLSKTALLLRVHSGWLWLPMYDILSSLFGNIPWSPKGFTELHDMFCDDPWYMIYI